MPSPEGFKVPDADEQAQACNRRGITLAQQGSLDEAVASFQQALQLRSAYVDAHNNLGNVRMFQGRLDEAVACYQRALQLLPAAAVAYRASIYSHLCNVLQQQGKSREAVACGRQALQLQPESAKAHNNLGNALRDQGQLEQAEAAYRRALALDPQFAEAHHNLAIVAREQGKLADSIASSRRALELKPDYAGACNNLGLALQDEGRTDESLACYRRALELKPDYAEAQLNLGNVLRDRAELDEAIACYHRALELKPDYSEAHGNLGTAFYDQGKLDDALACYDRAVALKPDSAEARFNRCVVWLLLGNLREGWPEYECRWRTKQFQPLPFRQPLWDGQPLPGKTILLHAEQGLGDAIQFIRYAPLVQQAGARVVVECQRPLLRLLAGCRGVDKLIGRGDDLPPFDVYAPLLSLPGIFQTRLDNVPAEVPYLFAAPSLVEHWRGRLLNLPGFKVGIAWQGASGHLRDRWRSIPLRYFAPLAEIAEVRLVSLQKHGGSDQLAEVAEQFQVVDFAEELDEAAGPFMDTAALMTQLDLVITSDTVTAHLAGALGVPVWVALPAVPDWRWLLDRSDSPWYPTMRLFRQQKPADWTGVFDEIKSALLRRLPSFPAFD
jgi:tetratricopeptide (TPR) repeat protein